MNVDTLLGEAIYAFESATWEFFDFVTVRVDEDFYDVRRGVLHEAVFPILKVYEKMILTLAKRKCCFDKREKRSVIEFSKR